MNEPASPPAAASREHSGTGCVAWHPGRAPVAVVMIALNEGHNIQGVCDNLRGWAQEVFLVDSFSNDATVQTAVANGVHVVQRRFTGFGDQWNFAMTALPVTAPWTMKLDPDERLSEDLKMELCHLCSTTAASGITLNRWLHFMGRRLPVKQNILRLWRSGTCRFTPVAVNEYPLVDGPCITAVAPLEHHDSPDLHHWLHKQNNYTTAEALMAYRGNALAATPRLVGSRLEQRMWLKKHFYRVPGRFTLFFLFHWLWLGAWRAGWPGYAWSRLRSDVMRFIEYKRREMELTGREPLCTRSPPADSGARTD